MQAATNHMVCSAMGMVTVAPRKDSEFIALGDWMRERSTFYSLRSLRFFKHFKRAKSFRFWHRNVRFKLYIQVRNRLKQVSLPRPRAALPPRLVPASNAAGPAHAALKSNHPEPRLTLQTLFLAKKSFVTALLEMNQLCVEMREHTRHAARLSPSAQFRRPCARATRPTRVAHGLPWALRGCQLRAPPSRIAA